MRRYLLPSHDHPENNVKYHYCGINSSYNRIGRLMLREDGSGAIEYYYGSNDGEDFLNCFLYNFLFMKKILILLGFCILSCRGFCQSVRYAYDEAGNRVKREIVISKQKAQAKFSAQDSNKIYSDVLGDVEVKVYPNPTKGNLKVGVSNVDLAFTVRVFSSAGHIVGTYRSNNGYVDVDITNQSNGLYVLTVSVNGKESTWKIIKTN